MNQETARQLLDGHELRGGGTSELFIDGERFLNFSGCNYLALTNNKELRDAAQQALDEGVGFSRYLVHANGGHDPYFDAVEKEAKIPARFGLRHRAAVGVSIKTDAVCLTVSEETGQISYIRGGEFILYKDNNELIEILKEDLE